MSSYENTKAIAQRVSIGQHRALVGDMWEEIGSLQLNFLVSHGLCPSHRLLDIGCGSCRGGVKFAAYLDADHYYGTDLNRSLLEAGYEKEIIAAGLASKVPRSNLIEDGSFDFGWVREPFDYAIAQSVFTHLPLPAFRRCLESLPPAMKRGGKFYATFFEAPESLPETLRHEPGGIVTKKDADPYHFRLSDIESIVSGLPWGLRYIGEWGHPRSQRMLEFTRM